MQCFRSLPLDVIGRSVIVVFPSHTHSRYHMFKSNQSQFVKNSIVLFIHACACSIF